jgi:Uma2 family endonuclease
MPAHPQPYRLTKQNFYELCAQNLFNDHRTELIDGTVYEWPPRSNPFAVASVNLRDELKLAFGPERWVRTLAPLDLSEWSQPQPALAVVEGSLASWRGRREHPTTALLVAEIGDETLDFLRRKASLYAAAGIADYWVLNIVDNVLEVRRDPRPDATQDFGFGYTTLTTLTATDFATPLAAPNARIPVADLLPT